MNMIQMARPLFFALILCHALAVHASDSFFEKATLGEKNIDLFYRGQFPEIKQNDSSGKLFFVDDAVEEQRFFNYTFDDANYFTNFLQSELNAGMTCPNELLGKNYDYIRYGYRLLSLSFLIEDYWHLQALSEQFKWKKSCEIPLSKVLEKCQPKSSEMKSVVSLWRRHFKKNPEKFHPDFDYTKWQQTKNNEKLLSHYRVEELCKKSPQYCSSNEESFKALCQTDSENITKICSEIDQVYGATYAPQIFYQLSRSNFINTFNKEGMGVGCLRRFSQLMINHEGKIPSLRLIGLALPGQLTALYGNRFPQGRPFIYGALKEFADKGLTDIFEATPEPVEVAVKVAPEPIKAKIVETKLAPAPVVVEKPAPKKVFKEIEGPMKSAFLQAAEVRQTQDLDRVEVDMIKLKYDYVFSLNMIQKLTNALKTYMSREALVEMSTYDKLGTKEGPVPLLFIKFMIDMQEHQGLYNLIAVLGDKFYVSNEIDPEFKPAAELVEIKNDDSTDRQWQLSILKP